MSDNGTANPRIRPAHGGDLNAVLALLARAGLPSDGAAKHLGSFLLAETALPETGASLLACAGLERYGDVALLRSVAVDETHRKTGLGSRLVAAILQNVEAEGVREVLLLTTSAREFFVSRFHFEDAERANYDALLAASAEWNLPRCSSAAFLRKRLG